MSWGFFWTLMAQTSISGIVLSFLLYLIVRSFIVAVAKYSVLVMEYKFNYRIAVAKKQREAEQALSVTQRRESMRRGGE